MFENASRDISSMRRDLVAPTRSAGALAIASATRLRLRRRWAATFGFASGLRAVERVNVSLHETPLLIAEAARPKPGERVLW
jgi:hypothetical protein